MAKLVENLWKQRMREHILSIDINLLKHVESLTTLLLYVF